MKLGSVLAVVLAANGLLFTANTHASLILNVEGISGAGITTWALSGTSTVNESGTIRTSAGSAGFSVDDTFEPDVTGNFILNSSIQNQLFSITGTPTVTVGADTETITHIFLDEDGSSRDDFGIRTGNPLVYTTGESSSWSGTFTVALDIDNFIEGSYRLNTAQANGGGFLFASVNDVILNFRAVQAQIPEPSMFMLVGLGLAGLGYRRRKSV
ncbi:MAG: PEP-CTERM sorting domain-containing protein [Gammaproteobacteria bacterium]|nr:PEP-CTERM sorting domain-containing protein [Gammaproteobacteria bacterium]